MQRRVFKHLSGTRLWLVVLALTAACNAAAQPTATQAPTATRGPTATTGPTATPTLAPTPTIAGPVYDNPVFPDDFPDPHVLPVGDIYYAYSTNSGTQNIPTLRSDDLTTWERIGDAMPALPQWAQPNFGNTWAPGVIQIGETFVMYFTARDKAANLQCIGRAVAERPEGPFYDERTEAFVCQADLGGSIDAYPFRDESGQLYLFWKNDGNCCGKPVGLWVQALSEDGLTLAGEPTELIRRDQPWERPLIENPAMVQNDGTYYLFYSGNWWESHEYAVGYAVCETITGPCEKPLDEPIFVFTPQALGPGGEAFFTDEEGNLWMVYHAWTNATVGYPSGERTMHIDPVTFVDGQPVITGPTSDPQPLP